MALLVVILFSTQIGSRRNLADLASSRPAFAVAALFSLLPALSYFGWWDLYLSFRLYSGNTDRAALILSSAARQRLPPGCGVIPVPQTRQPAVRGPGP